MSAPRNFAELVADYIAGRLTEESFERAVRTVSDLPPWMETKR